MTLPPRDRFILITRYLLNPKWKLDRLSETLKMSRERIRQIGDDGLRTIRAGLAARPLCTKPVSDAAARTLDALVGAIEQAAAAPEGLADFMRANRIAVGPSRIIKRRGNTTDGAPHQLAPMARALPQCTYHGAEVCEATVFAAAKT